MQELGLDVISVLPQMIDLLGVLRHGAHEVQAVHALRDASLGNSTLVGVPHARRQCVLNALCDLDAPEDRVDVESNPLLQLSNDVVLDLHQVVVDKELPRQVG